MWAKIRQDSVASTSPDFSSKNKEESDRKRRAREAGGSSHLRAHVLELNKLAVGGALIDADRALVGAVVLRLRRQLGPNLRSCGEGGW